MCVWATCTVVRVDIGGKALTNYLKEVVSHRQWNVMNDTHLINTVKESLAFVAEDYLAELRRCRQETSPAAVAAARAEYRYAGILREFVLPDYQTVHMGFVKPPPTPPAAVAAADATAALPTAATAGSGSGGDDDDGSGGCGNDTAGSRSALDSTDREDDALGGDEDGDDGSGKKRRASSSSVGSRKRSRPAADKDDDSDDDDGNDSFGDDDDDDDDDEDDIDVAALKRLEEEADADRQVLVMNNERIAVPEALFHPIDIGTRCFVGRAKASAV